MTLATARNFPRHSHEGYGVGLLAFGGHRSWSGLGTVEALPGDMITVNPGEIHDGQPIRGQKRGWRMIYLAPTILDQMAEEAETGPFEFVRPSFRDEPIARMFVRLFSALTAQPSDGLAAEERLALFIDRLLAERTSRRLRETPGPIARALQQIDDQPAAKVTLAELASVAGMSRFQLLRAFSQRLGVTPHAYLLQRRVRLACTLLRAGTSPVQAAAEAGFSDQSHMTRVFARCYGVTPARFQTAIAVA